MLPFFIAFFYVLRYIINVGKDVMKNNWIFSSIMVVISLTNFSLLFGVAGYFYQDQIIVEKKKDLL